MESQTGVSRCTCSIIRHQVSMAKSLLNLIYISIVLIMQPQFIEHIYCICSCFLSVWWANSAHVVRPSSSPPSFFTRFFSSSSSLALLLDDGRAEGKWDQCFHPHHLYSHRFLRVLLSHEGPEPPNEQCLHPDKKPKEEVWESKGTFLGLPLLSWKATKLLR